MLHGTYNLYSMTSISALFSPDSDFSRRTDFDYKILEDPSASNWQTLSPSWSRTREGTSKRAATYYVVTERS